MSDRPGWPGALELTAAGRTWTLQPGQRVRLGRTEDCDIVIDGEVVSRHHAIVVVGDDGWVLRDTDSRNGTFADGDRVWELTLSSPCEVRLGDPETGPLVRLAPHQAHGGSAAPGRTPAPAPRLAPPPSPEERPTPAPGPQPSRHPASSSSPLPAARPAPHDAAPRAPGPPSPAPLQRRGYSPDLTPASTPVVPPAERAPYPADRPRGGAPLPAPGGPLVESSGLLADRTPSAVYRAAERLRVGRALDNDVVVDDLVVSRHHAEVIIPSTPGAIAEVVDLDSGNGTFVNGRRITRSPLRPDDLLSVGPARFLLRDGLLVEHRDTGRISFSASSLGVTVPASGASRNGPDGRKVLLDDVSFALEESTLLAVVGPSGAGKSTLLGALTGFRPAGRGRVLYDGRDLYQHYADLRHRIGFVPQDDVLHPQLTVRRALTYAARLRFGEDTSAAERAARVEEVIVELGLSVQADLRIDRLSGGQRKRTSVALELLTKPSLLFLDEPTSGLDPGLDKQVMATLRGLADGGRTVVVVTHSVANLSLADRVLLLAPGGSMAFFGPPGELLDHFGMDDHSDVFLALSRPGTDWGAKYRASPAHDRYVGRTGEHAAERDAGVYSPPPRRQRASTQLRILCRRYLDVVAADRQYVAFLAILPIALSVLARIVPAPHGLAPPHGSVRDNHQAVTVLLVLVVSGALMGTATAVRELIKEREVYRRERSVGLSPVAYLTSKAVVLTGVVVLQSLILVALSLVGRALPADGLVLGWSWPELAVAVALVGVASLAIGLVISAAVTTADQAMPLMVLVVMTQIVFAGALFPLHGRVVLSQISWAAPTRWGVAQLAGTTDLPRLIPGSDLIDSLWADDATSWLWQGAIQLGITLVALIVAERRLRRLDPR